MKTSIFGYLIFSIILIALTLSVGPMFYLAEVVVVCIATLCVFKYLKKMSLLVLSAIVIIVTVVFPLLILRQISEGSSLSLSDYLIPTNLQNIKALFNFILPFLAFIITAKILRKTYSSPG